MDKYLCLKESDVVIPDGDVESSSDDDDDDDSDDEGDEDEERQEADGDNAEDGYNEANKEDTAEILAESKEEEEDQLTAEIEEQANLVDEESKLSQVKYTLLLTHLNVNLFSLFRMNFVLKQQLSWVYQKTPRVHRRIFKVLPYREKR